MPGQQFTNGQSSSGQQTRAGPRDELDMYDRLLESSRSNPLLDQTNLGHGKYGDDEFWQQIRSYRKGLYAYIAFGSVLTQRAVYETQIKLAREGYVHYDENQEEVKAWEALDESDYENESQWVVERRRGQEIWEDMNDTRAPMSEKQAAAVIQKAGIDTEWLPVYWQMVAGRHEASRSRGAELLRDILTGITELRGEGDGDVEALLEGT